MTAAAAVVEQVLDLPLEDVLPSTVDNYRKQMSEQKLIEMADSMREHGVLEPIVVRPSSVQPGGLELVFGARRVKAATEAGLKTVPAIIRDYSDQIVRETRLVENAQREDASPLDEAAAFTELLGLVGSEDNVAVKTGKTLRYVRERLALNGLCAKGREALEKGTILLDVALLVAALPHVKMQEKAFLEFDDPFDGLMTVAVAREAIQSRVLLDLSAAPFKLDDATLVPAAGACTTCPKHTSHQGNLFGQADKEDHCLDGACHQSKVDALYQLRVKQARDDGQEVLSKKASAEALDHSKANHYGTGPLVRLDEQIFTGKGGRRKQLKALFGKEVPPITLARDPESGAPVELVPRAAAEKVIKAASPQSVRSPASEKASSSATKEREAERLKAEVRRRVVVGLVENLEELELTQLGEQRLAVLQAMLRAAIHALPPDVRKAVANRRGLPLTVEEGEATSKRGKGRRQEQLTPEERLERLIPALDIHQLPGLLLELLIVRAAPGKWSEAHESYSAACSALGVDLVEVEKNVKAERKAKAEKKPKAKAKAAKKGKPKSTPEGVTHFSDGSGGNACGKPIVIRVGEGQTNAPGQVTCPGCKPAADAAAAKAAVKPKRPRKAKAPPATRDAGLPTLDADDGSV